MDKGAEKMTSRAEEISYLLQYQAELKSVGNDLSTSAKAKLTKLLKELGYHKPKEKPPFSLGFVDE